MRRRLGQAGVIVGVAAVCGGFVAAGPGASGSVTAGSRPVPPSSRGLDVLPFPGTPDASPGTNIDFPAISPAQVRTVAVVGSRSGRHAGHVSAQPAGHGTAFSPDRPFTPGEHVTVTAALRSSKAATASGAPGQNRITFSFTIARPAVLSSARLPPGAAAARRARPSRPRTHSFVTHPGFHAPIVTMSGKDPDTASGDIFLGAQDSGQNAPYILDPQGRLLWYQPKPQSARDVRVQSYRGQPVITYWQGVTSVGPGGGRGKDVILDWHYHTIHTVRAGDGYRQQGIDLHEFFLGHQGSEPVAFVSIWSAVRANLTSIGGPPNGKVYDWIVQEIDVATGKVIWEWHALGHVPVSDSHLVYVPSVGYDYFHLNSIQQLPDGNVLVSSRNTWTVYLIDKATGKIIWSLGGKHSSFKMERGTNFEWQHDATLLSDGILTLFDDGVPAKRSQSRALKLHIDTSDHRATLVRQYEHSPPAYAHSQGSAQRLPNGNMFVGWGWSPYFSEYSPTGRQLFSGSFVSPVESYRAFRFKWIGSPLQPPAIAVRSAKTSGKVFVYASWNGATQVAKWQILASSSRAGRFARAGRPVAWSGFETKTETAKAAYFKVQALNSQGRVLGTSATAAGP